MDRLAFEKDRHEEGRGPAAGGGNGAVALAGLLIALTVGAIAAAEHAAATSGVAPARGAFDDPPLGRPGRRF